MSANEHTASSEKQDVYARVTSQIVNAIEQGVSNWRMPWHTSGKFAFSPVNVVSRKPYRGINTVCLWAAAQAKGYERGEWGTYQQWQERGAQVRKGEKATLVVFWKFANNASETDDGEDTPKSGSRLLFTRGYSVFNAAQVDGYAPKADADTPIEQRIESAEQFFSQINARVTHQGNRAFYSPDTDAITLPPFAAFFSPIDYYSTRAHETGHWTSTANRCDRQLGKRFGDNAYSVEELVAELTAAFTLAHLGLSSEPRPDHAQYIASWLKVLKADKRAIFTAASKAQQAADYLIQQAGQSAHVAEVAA
ncbi:MAG TPA: zincin-like metallopeptidase domain-containing protein [Bryobacteraceae bacterium]|nr:zincin-like metallopeptidase domain-containing protein [Bryobacteraceae bacterium]